ncbi:MAG: response regulator [Chitinophagaceae bacterium]
MDNTQIPKEVFRIIVADDDFEDFQLIKKTFLENEVDVHISHVENGQYLMDILTAQSKHPKLGNLPHIILLDLNMPRKTGLEVLKEIKENSLLSKILIIIFTTSTSSTDIKKAYELGANCYVTKPQSASEWTQKIGMLGRFWMECVKLPA